MALFGVGSVAALESVHTLAATEAEALHYLSLEAAARKIQSRAVSPVDLTKYMLDRIAKADPVLKAYATVMPDQAMADARAAAREIAAGKYRGPLHGVPVAVKDLCYTKGVRTMGGTAARMNFIPDYDATLVSKLRGAGAVILGKLNLSEGATAGYNPAMGVPLNPWNHDRWPGMSSSGSGVAAAAGLCFAAVGTDTGGSIRNPASANGVVGLKPTYGRVSRYGVMDMSASLDHVGCLAREVADACVMFDTMAGRDAHDATSLNAPPANTRAALGQNIRGLMIGIDRAYAFKGIDHGQAAALEAALGVLTGLGARIVDVKMPDLSDMLATWQTICGAEIVVAHKADYPAHADKTGPYFRMFLEGGTKVTPDQLAAAREKRTVLSARFSAMLETVDVMVGPAGGDPAWPITHAIQVGPLPAYHAAWSAAQPRSAEFTMPMDLAGTPAICLPCGFSPDGLPYSIQFSGRRLSEAMLCRVAHAYEQATGWHRRHPVVAA
ncbi:MAG TPA: amidase [Rhizomicrobium sp.]